MIGVQLGEHGADLVAEHALQRHRQRVDEHDVGAELARRGGDLRPDPAGADDRHALGGTDRLAESVGVVDGAEVVDAVERGAGKVEVARSGAGGQHGGRERNLFATVELDRVGRTVERLDGAAGQQLDVAARVEVVVVHSGRLRSLLAAQHRLGERWALVRRRRFVADEDRRDPRSLRRGRPPPPWHQRGLLR